MRPTAQPVLDALSDFLYKQSFPGHGCMAVFEDARPACPLPEVCSFSFSDCIKVSFPDGTRLEAMQKVYGTAPVHDPAHKAHPDKPVFGMYVIAMDGTPAETLVDRSAAMAD